MAKKPLYRVAQNETVKGWPILDWNDNCVAHCATRSEARTKAKQLISEYVAFGAPPPAAA